MTNNFISSSSAIKGTPRGKMAVTDDVQMIAADFETEVEKMMRKDVKTYE